MIRGIRKYYIFSPITGIEVHFKSDSFSLCFMHEFWTLSLGAFVILFHECKEQQAWGGTGRETLLNAL